MRRKHYEKNKAKIIKQTSDYTRKRIKNDPEFKLLKNMRCRVYVAFTSQNQVKKERTCRYLGCTKSFFQKWIRFQLYDGMTMGNYGSIWHIDHVIPCASFDLSKKEDIYKCFNWKNCRPYLSHKNLSKSDAIDMKEYLFQEIKANRFTKLK